MQLQPNQYGTLPSSHSRTPSDPITAGYHTLSHTHKRSPSGDSSSGRSVIHIGRSYFTVQIELYFKNLIIRQTTCLQLDCDEMLRLIGNKLVIASDCKNTDKLGFVKRPQNPPPPAPNNRLSNGRSTESISSMTSDLDALASNPLPPPRRVGILCKLQYVSYIVGASSRLIF